VGMSVLAGLAQSLLDHAQETGHLPANVALPGGKRVGLGSLYWALAGAYAHIARCGEAPQAVDLWRFWRQPAGGVMIGQQYAAGGESFLGEPNLDTSRIYRYGKLQTWTLAPCWE